MMAAPAYTAEDVAACSFPTWYPLFSSVSLRAASFPVPPAFLSYLTSDQSLLLPASHAALASADDPDGDLELHEDAHEAANSAGEFPEVDQQILRWVDAFDGSVFPKLNWSAPRDAAWIGFDKTLRCRCPADVYLLLKSSDLLSHDLALHCPSQPLHLVLKKWYELRPEREFRCFVRGRRLVGVCQRHGLDEQQRQLLGSREKELVDSLLHFYRESVKEVFPREDVVMDVYWTPGGRWKIIDFNPFGSPAEPRLFSWQELEGIKGERPELRLEADPGILPGQAQFGLPVDVIDLATGNDPRKLMDLLRESVRRQQQDDSSSSDDD